MSVQVSMLVRDACLQLYREQEGEHAIVRFSQQASAAAEAEFAADRHPFEVFVKYEGGKFSAFTRIRYPCDEALSVEATLEVRSYRQLINDLWRLCELLPRQCESAQTEVYCRTFTGKNCR